MMTLEESIADLLIRHHMKVAFAESCTGGMAASMLIDAPGISECLEESFITYSEKAKHDILGVSWDTLHSCTAVSEQCCREMADGLVKRYGVDCGVSVTGYAGPSGAQIGHVFIGCRVGNRTVVEERHYTGSRLVIRETAAQDSLKLLRNMLYEMEK